MIALTMVLQMFAVISPPQSSLQASPNFDIINGGFSSKQEAVNLCKNNTQNYKKILNHFGITCAALANGEVTSVKPRAHGGDLYSMGRSPVGTNDEVPVNVPGVGTLYVRHFWQKNHEPSYKALKIKTSDGKTVYILYDCGNLITIGIPKPPKTCEWNDDILASDPKCFEPCPIAGKKNLPKTSPQCFEPCPIAGKKNLPAKDPKCFEPCPVKGKENIPKTSKNCFEPCPYNAQIAKNSDACKPCEESQTKNDLSACLTNTKAAKNITQSIADANGTTAKSSDVIEYTLTTKNKGKITVKDFIMSDSFGDVLDYADVVDLHGGKIGEYSQISWPKEELKAGGSVTHRVTVKIKNPIPATPVSSSDPTHFDMKMVNTFGNTIEIDLPKTPEKQVELIAKQLPNTGPGTSLIIGFSLTMVVGYFFARSRLLAKELDIVRADFGAAGGY